MDMFESSFSPSWHLTEQVARQAFENLPEGGPIMVIVDRQGHHLPSDSERFTKMGLTEHFLQEVLAKVDDGAEPLISESGRCAVVAAQLATERTNCGYLLLLLPGSTAESAIAQTELLETLVGQVNLVARLIEKNSLLYELQLKHQPGTTEYVQSQVASN